MQKGRGFSRVLAGVLQGRGRCRWPFVVFFLAGAFFGVVFTAASAALADGGVIAFMPAFLVRIPHMDSKAFRPGVPGFGRSQTMCAWSRGSTSPSSLTRMLLPA